MVSACTLQTAVMTTEVQQFHWRIRLFVVKCSPTVQYPHIMNQVLLIFLFGHPQLWSCLLRLVASCLKDGCSSSMLFQNYIQGNKEEQGPILDSSLFNLVSGRPQLEIFPEVVIFTFLSL